MKRNIALVAGGYSGEYDISIKSAAMIKKNIDLALFDVYTIVIGSHKWVCVMDDGSESPVDKNDFSVEIQGEKVHFDCVFITIHGSPGEDGMLQGYLEMMGIPYTTAGLLPSALTFNKHFCAIVARHFGMHVAGSVKFVPGMEIDPDKLLETLGLPVFVKPNKGGSSLGNSLVEDKSGILPAVKLAFEHDDEVLVEQYIQGQELTCGVYRREGKPYALPVTAIRSKSGVDFFDFKAKYTKEAAEEITPAPISDELTRRVRETTTLLYEKFEMKGLARIDYIYKDDKLYFLEINVTPGMSETSIVPQQAAVEGITITDLFTSMIEGAMALRS